MDMDDGDFCYAIQTIKRQNGEAGLEPTLPAGRAEACLTLLSK